jgi:CRP-like cAMP-binding protein
MPQPSLSEEINQIPLIAAIPVALRRLLVPMAHLLDFTPSSVVFREGAPADALYLVSTGSVALEVHVPVRGNIRILTVGPGELLGWSAVLGNATMTATARALEPARLIAFPAAQLRDACSANHELGYHLMRQLASTLSSRLTATRLQLLDAFAESAPHLFAPLE